MSVTTGGGATRSHFDVPVGMIMHCGHANDPGLSVGDWLECNGQNVSRAVYAALFAAIGTTHGVGDGATTFGMPDSRRRSLVGKGGVGTGTLGNAVGNTGGEETHVETAAQSGLTSHGHQQSVNNNAAAYVNDGGTTNFVIALAGATNDSGVPNNTQAAGGGSGAAQNVYHPALVCGVWIKT